MGPFIPPLPILSCEADFFFFFFFFLDNNLSSKNNKHYKYHWLYLFDSTVKLNKSYILSNSTVGKKFSQ